MGHLYKIKSTTKEVYFSVVTGPAVRTDEQIAKANTELSTLQSQVAEFKKIQVDLEVTKDNTLKNLAAVDAEISATRAATLNTIAKASEEVISVKSNSTAQIIALQNEVATLRDNVSSNVTTINSELVITKEASTKLIADLESKQKVCIESEVKIIDLVGKLESHKTNIESIDKNTTLWEAEIKKAKEEIAANNSSYEITANKIKNLQGEIEKAHERIFGKNEAEGKEIKGFLQETDELKTKVSTFLSDQEKKYLAQFSQIESLLPGATSIGLAKAYQEQKNSYEGPIRYWSLIFVGT